MLRLSPEKQTDIIMHTLFIALTIVEDQNIKVYIEITQNHFWRMPDN